MSDALTDIARDERLGKRMGEVNKAEADFLEAPSVEKAKKLYDMWTDICNLPGGYWSSPPVKTASLRLAMLDRFINTGELSGVALFLMQESNNNNVFYLHRAIGGHGRWMGGDLDEIMSLALKRKANRNDAVKVEVTETGQIILTPLTCPNCPFVYSSMSVKKGSDDWNCGITEYCKGHDEKKRKLLRERYNDLVAKGKSLYQEGRRKKNVT